MYWKAGITMRPVVCTEIQKWNSFSDNTNLHSLSDQYIFHHQALSFAVSRSLSCCVRLNHGKCFIYFFAHFTFRCLFTCVLQLLFFSSSFFFTFFMSRYWLLKRIASEWEWMDSCDPVMWLPVSLFFPFLFLYIVVCSKAKSFPCICYQLKGSDLFNFMFTPLFVYTLFFFLCYSCYFFYGVWRRKNDVSIIKSSYFWFHSLSLKFSIFLCYLTSVFFTLLFFFLFLLLFRSLSILLFDCTVGWWCIRNKFPNYTHIYTLTHISFEMKTLTFLTSEIQMNLFRSSVSKQISINIHICIMYTYV